MTTHTALDSELEMLLRRSGGPTVVAIGGGHGLAVTLRAITGYTSEITAVVSVADDGGSSGRLVSLMDMPAPGDIRRCLQALTLEPTIWSELFEYRFPGGPEDPGSVDGDDVAGHALGNLLLAAMADQTGNFAEGVALAGRLLGIVGKVLPVTDRPVSLSARIGGREVEGQVAVARTPGGIEELRLSEATALESVLEAVQNADQIVLAPGSLFTSVIAALAVPPLGQAVGQAAGRLVYVANLITQDSETLGMTGADHLKALRTHGQIDRPGTVLTHQGELAIPSGLTRVEFNDRAEDWMVVRAPVADLDMPWPEHDPVALGSILAELA